MEPRAKMIFKAIILMPRGSGKSHSLRECSVPRNGTTQINLSNPEFADQFKTDASTRRSLHGQDSSDYKLQEHWICLNFKKQNSDK